MQSEYSMPITSSFDGFVRGLFTYYPENGRRSQQFTVDDYGLLNVYAGIRDSSGVWDVTAFVKNATKASTALSRDFGVVQPAAGMEVFGSSGYYATSFTPRREFGLIVRYAFGSR